MPFVLVLSGLVGVLSAGCSRGDDPSAAPDVEAVAGRRAAQVRAAALDAGLPAEVADVLARAARAPAATFSAVFAVDGVEGSVVVHQRPPRRRVDVVDGSGRTVSSFVTGDRPDEAAAVRCERVASGEHAGWRCEEAGVDGAAGAVPTIGAFDPRAVDRTVEALRSSAAPVVVERRTVAGVAARCVTAGPDDRFCVSPAGVPVLVQRGDGGATLRATTYRDAVDDEDLRRPDG